MKILIVDDESGTRNALKTGLTSFGYQVLAAADAPEALKIIESSINTVEPVEIMVTDLRMPDMNGLELLRSARQVTPRLPIILITAYGNDHIRRKVKELDACEYVEKPFGPESLREMIKKIG